MNNENEKENALKLAIAQVEKDFGKGSVMRLGDRKVNLNVVVIPTGIFSLDIALGVGGFPRGKSLKYSVQKEAEKQRLHLRLLQVPKNKEGKLYLLM